MMSGMTQPITPDQLSIVPADQASWDDLKAIFGSTDYPAVCQCQRFKIRDNQWASVSVEERAQRLREQTGCGNAGALSTSSTSAKGSGPATSSAPANGPAPATSSAGSTTGLVAYLGDEPVGWCAVEPRTSYPRLVRARVPWTGRDEDKTDGSVWVVSCFVTRKGFRRRGITYALARATVGFARERGARALEAYPMITQPGVEITWGELHVGSRDVFAEAGFTLVNKPTLRRVVMRIDF
jgi:GNAT superfamily N-acetyltransferase